MLRSVLSLLSIVAFVMLFAAIRVIRRALANPEPSVHEAEAIYRDPEEIQPRKVIKGNITNLKFAKSGKTMIYKSSK